MVTVCDMPYMYSKFQTNDTNHGRRGADDRGMTEHLSQNKSTALTLREEE